jgi:hypothetical protein
MGFRPTPLVRNRWGWWALAEGPGTRWVLVSVPETLTEPELATFDPTMHEPEGWPSGQWPPLGSFSDVGELILAILRRRRTTTIDGQMDRRAVNAYLDDLPGEQRRALASRLAAEEPTGWATLEELRCYYVNVRVKGRQTEAVRLFKETAQRLWPQTMTAGRLTQFGKRCGDEVFMVLPYESWATNAEDAVTRAVEDSETTTGDTVRAHVLQRPFSLSLLT